MFDKNQLFSDAAVITDDRMSTAVQVNKTPADGVWIEVAVTASTGDTELLDVTVREAATTPTAGSQTVVTFPQITGPGRYFRKVQTKLSHLGLHYNITGTSASFTVTAGIVPAPQMDALV